MDILVLGEQQRADELIKRLPAEHNVQRSNNVNDASLPKFEVIFDLNFDDDPGNLQYYSYVRNKVVFVGAVKQQLASVAKDFGREVRCQLVGMNTLPTFIDRDMMELSVLDNDLDPFVEDIISVMNWDYHLVKDRVGMATPRVLFMIINEACFTLQEGTASVEDIDLAMKLGTNYPYGPFEWADRIGVKNVYETLEALYQDTHDERYKICPLLKSHYLLNKPFLTE